jgi:hypothetical protein
VERGERRAGERSRGSIGGARRERRSRADMLAGHREAIGPAQIGRIAGSGKMNMTRRSEIYATSSADCALALSESSS